MRHIFILYGGWGSRTGLQSDTWKFDPMTNTWTEYETAETPGPMYGHRLEYDSRNERIMLYGGHLRSPVSREYIEDIWYFFPDNSSWIKSNLAYKPHGRYWNALASSNGDSLLVVFGGTYGEGAMDETWILNTSMMKWTQLDSLESPSRRVISDMVYIESINSFLLFGGGGLIENSYQQYNDTWVLDPNTWMWKRIQTRYTAREGIQIPERRVISGF